MKKRTLALIMAVVLVASAMTFALVACDKDDKAELYVSENMTFDLSGATVMGLPVSIVLDNEKSGITLGTDGSLKLSLVINSALINSLLKGGNIFGFELSIAKLQTMLDGLGEGGVQAALDGFVNTYLSELVPGFKLGSADDVAPSFALLKNSLGAEIVGVDLAGDKFKELYTSVVDNNKIPEKFELPEGFGIEFNGKYELRDVKNPDTGETVKAIYVGYFDVLDDPYLMLSMYDKVTENKTEKHIYCNIRFIKAEIDGVLKA